MYYKKRLQKVFSTSKVIPFDNFSKFILMSDCHRGNNSWADDFARNENIYCAALNYYYTNGFTYIEIGDGDELWQFGNYSDIKEAHNQAYQLLRNFFNKDRMYMIWGNHDAYKKDLQYLRENLFNFYNALTCKQEALFDRIHVHEGIILKHADGGKIFLLHGHQADNVWGSNALSEVNKFIMRFIWKPLELYLGFKDPISPAKNFTKRDTIDKKITEWVVQNKQFTIAGHTHRPLFPKKKEAPYFNTGSCVHPYSITGIEIALGLITLVKWSIQPKHDGTLFVKRDILAGPEKLAVYF